MKILVGNEEGRWPKDTRIRKINSEPGDYHRAGALGTIVGALGPLNTSQRAELIIEMAKKGKDGDIEYIYWVEWDDVPGIPTAITDNRIESVEKVEC